MVMTFLHKSSKAWSVKETTDKLLKVKKKKLFCQRQYQGNEKTSHRLEKNANDIYNKGLLFKNILRTLKILSIIRKQTN